MPTRRFEFQQGQSWKFWMIRRGGILLCSRMAVSRRRDTVRTFQPASVDDPGRTLCPGGG